MFNNGRFICGKFYSSVVTDKDKEKIRRDEVAFYQLHLLRGYDCDVSTSAPTCLPGGLPICCSIPPISYPLAI